MDCGSVLKVGWSDVLDQLVLVNPQFAECFEGVARAFPDEDLFVARYAYGKLIVDRGQFAAPCNDRSCASCQSLRNRVGYSCIPFAVLLEKCVEVFVDYGCESHNDNATQNELRFVPLRLLGRGEMFGVFELLDRILDTPALRPPWSVSAGARSVWIVAPMGDERIHNWIRKKTGVRWMERVSPDWQLVAALEGPKWQVGVLIFPDWILKAVGNSPILRPLLLETGWKQSSNLRHTSLTDASLQTDFLKQNIKTPLGELYQYATVRHLLDIASGVVPAFQPASRARTVAGPFDEVEEVLRGVLKGIARDYQPVVLQPSHLVHEGDVGYYSFRCPSVPGPKLPRVANYADIPGTVHDVLKHFHKNPDVALDLNKTTFFARKGEYSIEEHTEYLPMEEFFPSNSSKRKNHKPVYLNSPFFVSGARIVRSGKKVDNAISKAATA